MKFIVDANVGKLVKRLRMMGYDTLFFKGEDDAEMVAQALAKNRVLLTRDTHLMEWGAIHSGRIQALLVKSDNPDLQITQVVSALNLEVTLRAFTICLVCNQFLEDVTKVEISDRVPPYVFQTQNDFKQCPTCHRVYWRGTHWKAMIKNLELLDPQQQ